MLRTQPPPLPTAVKFARGRDSVTYSYAIEKIPAETGIYIVILLAIGVICIQYLPLEYITKIIIQAFPFATIFLLIIAYDYLAWGNGQLVVSLGKFSLIHRKVPKKGNVPVSPEIFIPLQNITMIRLKTQTLSMDSQKKPIEVFEVVQKNGEVISLFQSRYAKVIFAHLRHLAQVPEIQKALPDLKFEDSR